LLSWPAENLRDIAVQVFDRKSDCETIAYNWLHWMEALMSAYDPVLLTAATLLARKLENSYREEATAEEVEHTVTLALRNGEKLLKELKEWHTKY
jgi:hypothetical protein